MTDEPDPPFRLLAILGYDGWVHLQRYCVRGIAIVDTSLAHGQT